MPQEQYTTPTEYFDAWYADFKQRLDKANLLRNWAMETPYPRHARRLHEAADREVDKLTQMEGTQRYE